MRGTRILETRIEDPGLSGVRIDRYIADHLGLFSRSQVKSRVCKVMINGKDTRLGKRIKIGDVLTLYYAEAPPLDVQPENIPLDIVFEDDQVIVVNKPQGMVVHPGSGNPTGTLVNALLFHCSELKRTFEEEPVRPGIVHRLDRDTSGVIIAAKSAAAHQFLTSQFRTGTVRKLYIAVVKKSPPESRGKIETGIVRDLRDRKRFRCTPAGGKKSVTLYRVINSYAGYTLVALRPKTGRTHQLRVHMLSIGCPILGDPVYAGKDNHYPHATLMLHALSLSIRLSGDEEPRTFRAPIPERFIELVKLIGRLPPRPAESSNSR